MAPLTPLQFAVLQASEGRLTEQPPSNDTVATCRAMAAAGWITIDRIETSAGPVFHCQITPAGSMAIRIHRVWLQHVS